VKASVTRAKLIAIGVRLWWLSGFSEQFDLEGWVVVDELREDNQPSLTRIMGD